METDILKIKILARPTNQLLNDFGAGQVSPGSGSAAALLALLSTKMITTICKISAKKPECQKYLRDFGQIATIIREDIEPKLKSLFEKDARDFAHVIDLRAQRDRAAAVLSSSKRCAWSV